MKSHLRTFFLAMTALALITGLGVLSGCSVYKSSGRKNFENDYPGKTVGFMVQCYPVGQSLTLNLCIEKRGSP